LKWRFRIQPEQNRHVVCRKGLPGRKNLAEKFNEPLPFPFGKRVADLAAQDFPMPDKPHVRVVCKLKNMLRAAQDAHETGGLPE
jgi:hypothetical protein